MICTPRKDIARDVHLFRFGNVHIPLDLSLLVFNEDFSEVVALSLTNNEDKKTTNASLILEDFNPPLSLYELPFHKEVPGLGALLSFSSKMDRNKSNNPGIPSLLSQKKFYYLRLLPDSHRRALSFKVTKFLKARWRFFLALTKRTSVPWMFVFPLLSPLTSSSIGD
ncbi:hypothetical protein Tco_0592798 [Tanacetum coccineum]